MGSSNEFFFNLAGYHDGKIREILSLREPRLKI